MVRRQEEDEVVWNEAKQRRPRVIWLMTLKTVVVKKEMEGVDKII